MAFALGTATGRIVLDYDGSGADAAKDDVNALQKNSMSTTEALNKTSRAATVGGLAIAAGLGVAVNSAADFEARMSAISAVSGATGDELDALRDKALQLGADTAFSASESAVAMEELVKAGLSTQDVLNGAADATVALAAAGEIDLPQAATIASNAMNQFSLAAKDLPNVADKIAGAANASAIDVGDFGMSLSQVGAVANLAGVSFEDTATAIALMGNAGIKGSDAGTSLKSMFARLNPSTKEASELMKELGIITEDGSNRFYDQQGNMKDLADVSQVLQGSLKGMTKEQQQATLNTLFGSDAIRAAAIMAKNGSKGFDQMANSIGKVKAADVAATRLDNFKGSIEQMKGSLETAGITIGTVLLPFLRQLVDAVTAAANWFGGLSDSTQKWIVYGIAAAGALLLFVGGLLKLIVFIGTVQSALAGLSAAFGASGAAAGAGMTIALGPILLVIAAIAALVVAVVLLWKHSERFRDGVMAIWGQIQQAVQAFVDFFVGEVWPELKSIFDLLMQAWEDLTTGTDGALSQIRNIVTIWINLMISLWTILWNTFVSVVQAIWVVIKGVIMGALSVIKGIINLVMGIIKGDWSQAWLGIKQIFSGVWTALKAIVKGALMIIKALIVGAWNVIKAVTVAAWNILKQAIIGVWNILKSAVSSAVGAIKGAIGAAWDWVKSKTSNAWDSIKTAVSTGVDKVLTLIRELPGKILDALSGLASDMYNKGVEIIASFASGIADKMGDAVGAVKDGLGKIGGLLPGSPVKEGPLKVLNQGYAGKQIVQMIIDGINAQMPALEAVSATAADVTTVAAVPVSGRGGKVKRPGGGRAGGGTQIRGWLRLTPDSRAYIEGIAVGVSDDDSDYDDTVGRMN